jgi:hypothetical protein
MPILRGLDPPMATWCNLRQAVQWLRDERMPVDASYERALGGDRDFRESDYLLQMKQLCAGLLNRIVALHGRPGIGLFKDNRIGLRPIYQWPGYDGYRVTRNAKGNIDIWFDKYGAQETIPAEKILRAGLQGFDFTAGTLTHVAALDHNANPTKAWKYIEVVIAAADLLRAFPPTTRIARPVMAPAGEAIVDSGDAAADMQNGTSSKPASDQQIREAVRSVYREGADDPPNLNGVVRPVQKTLGKVGRSASKSSIQKVAAEPEFVSRRRRQGVHRQSKQKS